MNTIWSMSKASQARAVEIWERLSRIHSSLSAALEKDMLPQAGISLGWYEVLAQLHCSEGARLRFQDLAQKTGLTESGASRRLEQMLKAGLIERLSCPTDKRGVYAHLTERGEQAFASAHAVYVKSLDMSLGTHFAPEEAEAIRSSLALLSGR